MTVINKIGLTLSNLPISFVVDIFERIYLTRKIDNKMSLLVKQNKGTSFFLSASGHEMVGAVAGTFLKPKSDWAFPYYRDRAFALSLGALPKDVIAAFLARDIENHSSGRMMLDHFSDPSLNIPCQSSCVGSQYLQAAGVALGLKLEGKKQVVYVSGGDGSTSQGEFWEALNFSSIHKLPIIFTIQDNGLAISTKSEEQTPGGNISNMVKNLPDSAFFEIDGTNIEECFFAFQGAINHARNSGPSIVLAHVPRIQSHTGSDDQTRYLDPSEIKEALLKDPLILIEKYLLSQNLIEEEELIEKKNLIDEKVEKASIEAEEIPFPKKETATHFVYKDFIPPASKPSTHLSESVVMMDAINHTLKEEMQRDPNIIVFGEDVAKKKGGVFGITRELTELFSIKRCFNTPLSEATIIGVAMGLSLLDKYKPIVEIQFADYLFPGMNQLVNEMASIHYRSNGKWNCPVVVRLPYGGYIQGGPYHSQSIETLLIHMPGLKIAVPSNAKDAKMLLKTAILDPNPVIFMEHKALYRQRMAASSEPSIDEFLPFGKANVVKEGKDITIVTWGLMVHFSLSVANKLEEENISVEVIDLRTLLPLDFETILNSLKKTSKLLVVHEAAKTLGFGAEIAARVMEEAFSLLDAPVLRVGAKDCPIPYCLDLESEILPQKEEIEVAIRKLVSY